MHHHEQWECQMLGQGSSGKLGDGRTDDSLYPVDVCAREKTSSEANCPFLSDVSK